MPFCCIAIVGVAIIYFIMLWIRQLFSWPRLDPNHPTTTATATGNKRYKPPPRALSGNGAWPVYGHTYLFMKLAGNTALEFPPHWRQVSFFPWTQQIGECFAIFFWGQWRVAIKGPKNAAKVMNGQRLKTDWPWTPPVALLGQSCLPILEEKDPQQADELRRLIETPLSHAAVLQFAPQFAECAAHCLHQIQQQQPHQHHHSGITTTTPAKHLHSPGGSSDRSINLNTPSSSRAIPTGGAVSEDNDESTPSGSCYPVADYKVKWQALRSYTLDIMVGPLWNMSLHGQPAQTKKMAETTESTQQPHGQSTKEEDKLDLEDMDVETSSSTAVVDPPKKKRVKKKDRPPRREHMLLWMERMKLGIDVIKTTFGPEWMYIWILNEYGRAINARMYVERHLSKHVKQQESMVPVSHKRGHATYETTTQMIPLLALKDNIVRSNEDIFGERRPRSWSRSESFQPRPRAYSHPNVLLAQHHHHHHHATAEESSSGGGGGGGGQSGSSNQNCESLSSIFGTALGELDAAMCSDYITPFETEQDLARPRYEQSPFQSPDPMAKKQKVGATNTNADGSSLSALKKQPLQPPAHPSESPSLRKGRKEMTAHHKQDVLRFAEPPGLVVTTDTDGKENKQQQYYAQEALQTPLPNKKKTQQQRTTPAPMPPMHHHHPNNNITTTPQPQQQHAKVPVVTSLLENLLLQKGENNKGISQTILTEISILLWMILDAGNAWTAMALHLLSNDRDACFLVQEEIDNLEERHGNHSLYTPSVLDKMKLLDALIFESIRLTPAFLGGLKSTTETVELDDAGVQIAKGSHVFFCQATDQKFDLQKAVGKRPEQLGKQYPTVELYGFLPLQGLEVPLMVLQCKVFLIAALRDFSPLVCRRRTFMRRVKNAVGDHLRSSFHGLTPSKDRTEGGDSSSCNNNNNNNEAVLIDGMDQMISDGTTVGGKQQESLASSTFDPEAGMTPGEVSQRDAMGFFTKIPFPEPKRVIRLRPRTID